MSKKLVNNIEALNLALDQALAKNPNVVMYGEDAGNVGGVFRATKGLQQKYGENRVFDAPIAEATIAGAALGMAINGLKPIIEIQFEGFIFPAMQNIFANIARYRNRSRGRFEAGVVVRTLAQGGAKALEHHSESLEAVFAHIPGVKVVMPAFPYDVKGLMAKSVSSKDPVIFLEPIRMYRAFRQEVPEEWYEIEFGKANKLAEGNQLTVVAYGNQAFDTWKALEEFKTEGHNYSVDFIDLRSIKPWDQEMVIASVKKTGKLLIVSEAPKSFSVASEIIATVTEHCLKELKTAPVRLSGYDVTIPYALGEVHYIPSVKRIKDKIVELINKH